MNDQLAGLDSPLIQPLIKLRKHYWSKRGNVQGLLQAVEKNENTVIILEAEPSKKVLDKLFFNRARIMENLSFAQSKSKLERAKKVYDFVSKHFAHRAPLYSGKELRVAQKAFSIYGSGYCDTSSRLVIMVADLLGLGSRQWALSGHVVTELDLGKRWVICDADRLALSFYPVDGQEASYGQLVAAARKNKLNPEIFNKIFAAVEKHSCQVLKCRVTSSDDLELKFLQDEQRTFLPTLYMVPTDGNHLERFKEPSSLLAHYRGLMANFVRDIPLEKNLSNGNLVLRDSFPFAGLFIQMPQAAKKLSPQEMPMCFVDSERLPSGAWMSGKLIDDEGLRFKYLDYTLALRTMEDEPTSRVEFSNLQRFLSAYPKARLVSVHYYSLKNTRFEVLKNVSN